MTLLRNLLQAIGNGEGATVSADLRRVDHRIALLRCARDLTRPRKSRHSRNRYWTIAPGRIPRRVFSCPARSSSTLSLSRYLHRAFADSPTPFVLAMGAANGKIKTCAPPTPPSPHCDDDACKPFKHWARLQKSTMQEHSKPDRLSFRYAFVALLVLIYYYAQLYFSSHTGIGDLVGAHLLAYFVYGVAGIAFAIRFGISIARRRFGTALSVLMGGAVLSTLLFFEPLFYRIAFDTVDDIRFRLNESHYVRTVEQTPAEDGAPKLIFFDWGSGGTFLIEISYDLVYDDSGEIARPDAARTEAWKARASKQRYKFPGENCQSSARRLKGHFYSVRTRCG